MKIYELFEQEIDGGVYGYFSDKRQAESSAEFLYRGAVREIELDQHKDILDKIIKTRKRKFSVRTDGKMLFSSGESIINLEDFFNCCGFKIEDKGHYCFDVLAKTSQEAFELAKSKIPEVERSEGKEIHWVEN